MVPRVLALFTLVALLAACGAAPDPGAPTTAPTAATAPTGDAAFPRMITDFEGREVAIPAAPQIVVIDNRSYILGTLLALGVAPQQLHVYPYPFSVNPTDAMPWEEVALTRLGAAPERIPSPDGRYSLEVLARAQPDLLIANPQSYGEGLTNLPELEALAPTVLIAGARDWRANITTIADALGRPDEGRRLVTEMEAKIASAAAHAQSVGASGRTFAVVSFASDGNTYVCTDTEYSPTSLLLTLGLTMTPEVAALDEGVCTPLSSERLDILATTDYLLVFQYGGQSLEQVLANPLQRAMPALAEERYTFIPDSALGVAFDDLNPLSIDTLLPTLREAAEKAAEAQ